MVTKLLVLACAVLLCASPACAQGPGAFNLGEIYSSTGRTVFDSAIQSSTTNPATSGFLRLANSDQVCWRNAGNTADVCLELDNSNVFQLPTAVNITGAATLAAGGMLAGTFSGSPTLSGNPTLSGTVTLSGSVTGSVLQGSDSKLLTAGIISGIGSPLCSDSAGGASTSGCSGATVVDESARIYNSSNESISSSTYTALSFDSVRWNDGGLYSSGSPTKLTAQVAGKYLIGCHVYWGIAANGVRNTSLRINGTTYIAEDQQPIGTGSIVAVQHVSTLWKMAVGDYAECVVNQTSGSSLDVLVQGDYSPEFFMTYVGP